MSATPSTSTSRRACRPCLRAGAFTLLALATATSPAAGQAATGSFWFGGAFGVGAIAKGADDLPFHAAAQVAYSQRGHVVTARSSAIAEVLGPALWDIGVLYGRAGGGPRSHTSTSLGVAFVRSELCPGLLFQPSDCEVESTVGVPLVAAASWDFVNFLSLGLEVSGNLNSVNSFVAGSVLVRLGSLR